MQYLSVGIIYVFEFLITVSFCNRVMDKKMKYSKILVCTFPLYIAAMALYLAFENLVINGIVSFFIYFLTMFIGYKERIYKQVIYTVYLTIINYVSEAVFYLFIFSRYTAITQEKSLSDPQSVLLSISSKIFNFILVQLLVLLIKHKEFNGNKKFLPLFIYPFISLCFCVQFVLLEDKYHFKKAEFNVYIIISVVNAIMCIGIFIYYGLLDEQDRKLKEFEKEQQFVELNNSYMQVLQSQNNDMHMIVHDVKNHYAAIASMDNADAIHSYVSSITDDIQKYQVIRLTDNKMLDLLLSKYKVECTAGKIDFNTEVKTANFDYIDDSDLSIIICNLLDNAVQAAAKSTAKQVALSLRRVNNFDVLTVTNSSDAEPKTNGGKIVTSKADKSSHGYGMRLIEKYARKNNAEYEWHYDNDKNTFNSTMIFKR